MVFTIDLTYTVAMMDNPKLVQFLSEKQNYKCFSLFTGVS